MKRRSLWIGISLALATVGWLGSYEQEAAKSAPEAWAISVRPGELSKFHASLEKDCTECHSPYEGVVREKCIVCHAAESEILKKQNTSFHSSVTSCTGCHFEHQGRDSSITKMDHTHLALVATEMVRKSESRTEIHQRGATSILQSARKSYHGIDVALEKTLNCNSCHANQDIHRSLFGSDCSSCHSTNEWSVPSFRHPAPTSRDCSQCHVAPPSHYMMHFQMVSEKVAGVEHADVKQCFLCHQTTSWNDIKGVGWYKHH